MLQQTQVSRVLDFYKRFLTRYPGIESLARARWPGVLSVWRGLGFYGRARRMMETAREVRKRKNWPETKAELVDLPGIGDYTASAIACFAFGEPCCAVDTNIRRVLSRYFGIDGKEVQILGSSLVETFPENARELNWALMDLGATICISRAPKCGICPVANGCAAKKSFKQKETGPVQQRRPKAIDVGAACVHKNGRYLIAKRPKAKGGRWELPGGKREPGEDIRACIKRELQEELDIEVSVRPAFFVRDVESDGNLYRVHFCRAQILRGVPELREHQELAWILPEEVVEFEMLQANREAFLRLKKMKKAG